MIFYRLNTLSNPGAPTKMPSPLLFFGSVRLDPFSIRAPSASSVALKHGMLRVL